MTLSLQGAATRARTDTGAVYCWGDTGSGQLGDGSTTDRLAPTAVAGGLRFADISAGGGHTCGVTAAGAAYCWGTEPRSLPRRVRGNLTFVEISPGWGRTCARTAGGVIYCWGANRGGALGDGTQTHRREPTPVR